MILVMVGIHHLRKHGGAEMKKKWIFFTWNRHIFVYCCENCVVISRKKKLQMKISETNCCLRKDDLRSLLMFFFIFLWNWMNYTFSIMEFWWEKCSIWNVFSRNLPLYKIEQYSSIYLWQQILQLFLIVPLIQTHVLNPYL